MRTVVIGGHTRNIGKTSVMAGLLQGLCELQWTAVKVTQYGHGRCSLDGKPCGCEPGEHAYVVAEESDPAGRADSCRYLAAGACRSLWLRVRQGQLGLAWPALQDALAQSGHVMIESNSILDHLRPDLYLVVVDSRVRDFKASARRHFDRADALVPVDSARVPCASLGTGLAEKKPVFPVSRNSYFSQDLCEFVRGKLLPGQYYTGVMREGAEWQH